MPPFTAYRISTRLPPRRCRAAQLTLARYNVLQCALFRRCHEKSCCSAAYRSALVARELSVRQHRTPAATYFYCKALVATLSNQHKEQPVQTTPGCSVNFNDAVEQSCNTERHCCNAYMKCTVIGLSRAIATPSQIVATAAAAVARIASIKSQQSRAPPAVGLSCCAVRASTGASLAACVVKSVLLA